MIQAIGTILVVTSAALAWMFCGAYHLSAPWRTSHAGRHIMAFTGVLAIVLTLWSVGAVTPTPKGNWWEIVRLVAFTGVPILLGHRLWLLWRLQIRPTTRPPSKDEAPSPSDPPPRS